MISMLAVLFVMTSSIGGLAHKEKSDTLSQINQIHIMYGNNNDFKSESMTISWSPGLAIENTGSFYLY